MWAATLDELLSAEFERRFETPARAVAARRVSELVAKPLRNGISPASNGLIPGEVLTLSAISGVRFDPSQRKTAMFAAQHDMNRTVAARDLLVTRGNGNRNLVGRGQLVGTSAPSVAFPDTVIGVTFDEQKVLPEYAAFAWNRPSVRRQIEAGAKTTNGTFKINQQLVESLEIPCPAFDEQKRFAELALSVAERRIDGERRASALDSLFASLQHRAFAGQL
ncbi:hypothetical protein [Agromyces archimandritae]|uniref:Type I restriction modification DNA specificity domain-containing protein n=1 Tax=Agromyces archimandritae TaxID=2781962 RepID=A0A975IPN6_9MICO|nr:hypothetical protein [Agromyces archimandritae]QTX05812.1 hypothetical protein G127AT_06310 [Agromyces archimandritae]